MTESKLDIERILGYVNGLLYFCGVMDLESLYRAVADRLGGGLSRPYFKNILDEELKKDDTPYDFILDDGLYCHYDVENPHWILDEQGKRAEIPYRPVTDKEVHQVVNKQYSSLWHPTVKTLSRQLQEQFGYTKDDAMMKVLLGQTMLNNGMPHLQLVEYFLYDLNLTHLMSFSPLLI